jgi:PAS domain S-box-containing protein
MTRESDSINLLETVPALIWSGTSDGGAASLNAAWSRYTGRCAEELLGFGWQRLLHPDDLDEVQRSCACMHGGIQDRRVHARILDASGRYQRFALSVSVNANTPDDLASGGFTAAAIRLSDSEVESACCACARDLQQAHDELAHVTRVATLGELTASIAHEVSQPLAAIAANGAACLRWLARAQPDMGEARLAVARMIKEAQRATDVVHQLRALARKDTTARKLDDVNCIIHDAVLLAKPQLSRSGVVLKLELCANLPRVEVHAVQLQQVLINLMTNGSQSMDRVDAARKVLTVSSSATADGGVRVVVRDVGTGIAAAVQDKLFTPFFTTRRDGMGMGLSICKTIIESHGGTIEAGNNVGPGAQLVVELPGACGPGGRAGLERKSRLNEVRMAGGGMP